MRRVGYHLPACGVALLAMLAQVGSYVHLASGDHVTCAEHGELVEVAHAASPKGPPERKSGSTFVAASSETHGHEHCLVAPHRRDHVAQSLARSGITSAHAPVIAQRLQALAPPAPIRLILLAPKSSPPV
jgi:hypothetical protein